MSFPYKIGCLCVNRDGQRHGDPFVIDIPYDMTVTDFQDDVHARLPIRIHSPDVLTLWRLEVPKAVEGLEEVIHPSSSSCHALLPRRKLSACFRRSPLEGYVHVLVELPPPLYTISCLYIKSDGSLDGDLCTINISSGETVGNFRDAVLNKNPILKGQIDARLLTLWRLREPRQPKDVRSMLKQRAISFSEDDPISVVERLEIPRKLSSYFSPEDGNPNPLPEGCVHVLVEVPIFESQLARPNKRPKYEEVESKMKSHLGTFLKIAPSSMAKHIDNYTTGEEAIVQFSDSNEETMIPIELMEKHFAKFSYYVEEGCTLDSLKFLRELAQAVCGRYEYEHPRLWAVRKVLEKYIKDPLCEDAFPGADLNSPYRTDGIARASFLAYLLRECKNKVSDEVRPQIIAYYAHYINDITTYRKHLVGTTRFPVLGILDTGHQLRLVAMIWVQGRHCLSDLSPLIDLKNLLNIKYEQMVASYLAAFLKTVHDLKHYYTELDVRSDLPLLSHRYPYPTSVLNHQVEYVFRFPKKLLFGVKINGRDGDYLLKFTRQYSSTVHNFLVDHNAAPPLLGFETLVSGWTMVLMAQSKYEMLHAMKNLEPKLSEEQKSRIKKKLNDVIAMLHGNDYVHGDLRDANILVDRNSLDTGDVQVHIVDFDWAGREKEAKYPLGVNTSTVKRPDGVDGDKFITKEHDNKMIDDYLFPNE